MVYGCILYSFKMNNNHVGDTAKGTIAAEQVRVTQYTRKHM